MDRRKKPNPEDLTDRFQDYSPTTAGWTDNTAELQSMRSAFADLVQSPAWPFLSAIMNDVASPYQSEPPKKPEDREKYQTFNIMRDFGNEVLRRILVEAETGAAQKKELESQTATEEFVAQKTTKRRIK